MKGDVDPCIRVDVLSASPLPRTGASSWVVEAKILRQDEHKSDEEEPYRTKPSRVGTWNEGLQIPLDAGDAQSCSLQLAIVNATLREEGLKACTFHLGDFVPWNGYHLNVHMGRDIRLHVSIVVVLEDPVVEIQHILHLEALLLTFPEGMPLPGVHREAGATVKSFVQCIPKGTRNDDSLRNSKEKEPSLQRYDAADEEIIELDALGVNHNGGNSYLRNMVPAAIVEDQVSWNESINFPVGPRVKKVYMGHTRAYPRQLYGKGKRWSICQQVSFLVTFFLLEASSQNSTALGFAVLEVPDDVRLSDVGVELSADVTSPAGKVLEDVVCVVDIKAFGPTPRSPRESDKSPLRDEDRSDLRTRSTEGSDSRSQSPSGASSVSTPESTPKSRTASRTDLRSSRKNPRAKIKIAKQVDVEQELRSQVEAARDQLQAAHADADRKQMMVGNLSEQVDKRSDAIRKCGAEIVKLRKRIDDVEQERCRLHSQLKALHRTTADAEMEANRVINAIKDGHPAGRFNEDIGGLHTRALAKRCIVLTEENKTLRLVAQDYAHERWQTAVLQSEMEKMRKTQHVQAVYIRKMQALPRKVSAYKATVSMQEQVIAKLEILGAGRRLASRENTDDREDACMWGGKKHGKGPEVERLRKENASLRWRLAMAGTKSKNNPQGEDSGGAGVILKMKESKIRILEEQMVTNAKAAGDEIAALQMRLMEIEFDKGDS
ncbi:unnamed protein product [Hapterophycus canaliculatus]